LVEEIASGGAVRLLLLRLLVERPFFYSPWRTRICLVSEKTTPLGNTVKRVHGCSTQPGKPADGNLVDEYTRAAQLLEA
jgi:hypothetical protein